VLRTGIVGRVVDVALTTGMVGGVGGFSDVDGGRIVEMVGSVGGGGAVGGGEMVEMVGAGRIVPLRVGATVIVGEFASAVTGSTVGSGRMVGIGGGVGSDAETGTPTVVTVGDVATRVVFEVDDASAVATGTGSVTAVCADGWFFGGTPDEEFPQLASIRVSAAAQAGPQTRPFMKAILR
jgi:hypothetical protein